MPTVEIRVSSSQLFKHMSEMRGWLDSQRFEPSLFKSTGLGAETTITVVLGTSAEAEAFAKLFAGSITSTPAVAGAGPGKRSPLLPVDPWSASLQRDDGRSRR